MRLYHLYINAYRGISAPVWMLSLVLLINRSGSMVLPFLSLYLREVRNFNLQQVGIILAMYGAGSLCGSLLGGFLTDKIGTFKVQLFSLVVGGAGFFVLFELQSFESLCAGFFIITVITDMLRPANASAIAQYAIPQNITRAYSLNRMAVNLGYAIGPAAGGFLALKGYKWLFYVDGVTCISAGLLFAWYFLKKAPRNAPEQVNIAHVNDSQSPYKDLSFLFFGMLTAGFAVIFFQLFTTLPLYYREVYILSENKIGWLLALNGLIVFGIEMPLVYALGSRYSLRRIVSVGVLMTGLAYAVLNLSGAYAILVISMAILSTAEILVMPYLTTYTVSKAGTKNRGKYLGFYAMTYSLAFIIAPLLGTYITYNFGFTALWYAMGLLGIAVTAGFLINMREIKVEPEIAKAIDAQELKN